MKRVSDLDPMLGYPGGICKVVKRVDDKLNEGYIENILIDKVENAEDLDNLEASVVYPRINLLVKLNYLLMLNIVWI